MRTGETAFRHVHGTDVWGYRAERPEESAFFDRAMLTLTRQMEPALREAYDLGRFATVVYVGGGNGAFLAGLLAAHPALHGVLFDQPHVVSAAADVPRAWRWRSQSTAGHSPWRARSSSISASMASMSVVSRWR